MPEDVLEGDFYRDLRQSENELDSEIRSMPEAELTVHKEMINHLRSILTEVLAVIRSEEEPDKVFAAALRGLSKVQQEQFILENILEAIKRGEELSNIMRRFEHLGLLPAQETATPADAPSNQPASEDEVVANEGGFLMRLRKKLGRSSMVLTKVALTAARAASKFAEVEAVIGFVGPIPTVSLQLKSKGASVDELLELVMDIV